MQISHLFTALLAMGLVSATPTEEAQIEERSCSGGKKWGDNRNVAIDHAGRWCSGNGGSEGYRAGQTKYGCYNLQFGNNKAEFWIQRKATTGGSLTSSQCNAYMQEQINNCERGGSGERNGWYFRADVNAGRCS
ncbi:hypothetical protein N7448_009759 [Penicillium atrosanguineum]|uniref:Glycan binding protein Y3-like domain-containing protein n=1 Tax=Penicillium atrosanguineum TaxID=1132637 RepID=A0A9W9Q2C2_9EURO|nr:uncharacterized protein N7443_007009 [Penicillium atrosanguineum]KAJ5123662.1 hypothetical protein N7448_009759 [Penicillium atrosanguineum]KAJ5142291.1 hypothetical protein N7526_003286 [Penicillium atrosanguineum]KAJ5298889.1 hypothetical protein N7443_007009 [Penicillium atrosanguineum]KAJ5320848.1 hypothetical protein N7476_003850 [Penicillium atrosanguineum]